ncbi:MAG: glycoside hydrolase family 3 protein [Solirubrobacterales bacterium]
MNVSSWRGRLRGAVWVVALLALAAALAAVPAAASKSPQTERQFIRQSLERMTLEEKVGQLFVVNGFGSSVHDRDPEMVRLNRRFYGVSNIAQLIRKFNPGGIIYFDWSNGLEEPEQVARLSNGIQRIARHQHSKLPLLISTDQEEGEVTRIGAPATVFPGNMALGAARSASLTRAAARITGEELRAMGVNVDNAPVVDVNVNPLNESDGVRSFGDRVRFVSNFGAAAVKGYRKKIRSRGVAATAKHFPGLGDVSTDPDDGVVSSPQTIAQVRRQNFPSLEAAIGAGADQVMVTHIVFPKITGSKYPSSLLPYWVKDRLRKELGFRGVAITDALDAASLDAFSPAGVALRAQWAGNDLLLEIADPEELEGSDKPPANLLAARRALIRAVKRNPERRRALKASVVRILRLKWRLGIVERPFAQLDRVKRVVGIPRHLEVADNASQRSITLLRNDAGLLPLAPNSGQKVLVTGFGLVTTKTIGAGFAARGLAPQVLDTGFAPSSEAIAEAVAAAAQNDLVVVSTFNLWTPGVPGQIDLVNALLATGKPVLVAAVGTPYDVAYLPAAPTFLTSLDYQPVSLEAMTGAVFGEFEPRGKLPVTVRRPAPESGVLYPFGYGLGYP